MNGSFRKCRSILFKFEPEVKFKSTNSAKGWQETSTGTGALPRSVTWRLESSKMATLDTHNLCNVCFINQCRDLKPIVLWSCFEFYKIIDFLVINFREILFNTINGSAFVKYTLKTSLKVDSIHISNFSFHSYKMNSWNDLIHRKF